MTTILKSYNLFIDSSQRDEGVSPSYFSILLQKPIIKTNRNSIFRVRITSVVIPFSFNQVNSTNNILSYTYNSVPYSITIPQGNYSITDLLTQVATLITAQTTAILNFTFDQSTSKCTLSFGSGNLSNQSISMTYSGANIIMMKMMGFTSNINFTYTFIGNTFTTDTSDQVVNVSPSKTLFIRSETLIQNSNYESLVGKNEISDILTQIPIQTSFNTFLNWYDQSSDLFSEINNNIIDKINLYLTDSTSNDELPADSGLLNWFIQLNIQEVYIDNQITDKNFIENTLEKEKIKDDVINDDIQAKQIQKQKEDIKKEINSLIDKKILLKKVSQKENL
jgi:hypothetical protein